MMRGNTKDNRGISRTVLDKSLLNYETIFCGGGSRDKILELKVKDIPTIGDNIVVADIAE